MTKAIVFDFDGVLVESVGIKRAAYVALFRTHGDAASDAVARYYDEHPGCSRFQLFDWFHRDVLQHSPTAEEIEQLSAAFSDLVVQKVVDAPMVRGAAEFLSRQASRFDYHIISGTPERELQQILRRRGLERYFKTAYGSPASKVDLFERLFVACGLTADDVVYVGDSEADWVAARALHVPFIWRQLSGDAPRPAGFEGPGITTLAELEASLAAYARR